MTSIYHNVVASCAEGRHSKESSRACVPPEEAVPAAATSTVHAARDSDDALHGSGQSRAVGEVAPTTLPTASSDEQAASRGATPKSGHSTSSPAHARLPRHASRDDHNVAAVERSGHFFCPLVRSHLEIPVRTTRKRDEVTACWRRCDFLCLLPDKHHSWSRPREAKTPPPCHDRGLTVLVAYERCNG